MSDALLLTKLYVPPPRSNLVFRPRLVEQLNKGLSSGRKLTLISAPAASAKPHSLANRSPVPGIARLSWCAAIQWHGCRWMKQTTIRRGSSLTWWQRCRPFCQVLVTSLLPALQSPQPLHIETLLIALLNEVSKMLEHFVLILEDYSSTLLDRWTVPWTFWWNTSRRRCTWSSPGGKPAVTPGRHYRARGQPNCALLTYVLPPGEAAELLNQVTGLVYPEKTLPRWKHARRVGLLGLQLAAISMQGHKDAASFIQSFTGGFIDS